MHFGMQEKKMCCVLFDSEQRFLFRSLSFLFPFVKQTLVSFICSRISLSFSSRSSLRSKMLFSMMDRYGSTANSFTLTRELEDEEDEDEDAAADESAIASDPAPPAAASAAAAAALLSEPGAGVMTMSGKASNARCITRPITLRISNFSYRAQEEKEGCVFLPQHPRNDTQRNEKGQNRRRKMRARTALPTPKSSNSKSTRRRSMSSVKLGLEGGGTLPILDSSRSAYLFSCCCWALLRALTEGSGAAASPLSRFFFDDVESLGETRSGGGGGERPPPAVETETLPRGCFDIPFTSFLQPCPYDGMCGRFGAPHFSHALKKGKEEKKSGWREKSPVLPCLHFIRLGKQQR